MPESGKQNCQPTEIEGNVPLKITLFVYEVISEVWSMEFWIFLTEDWMDGWE